MNTKLVEAIANAVLYEGYMLYPYRPSSVKNRQRFNFGVLYPPSYSQAQAGSDACSMQTECLAQGSGLTAVEIRIRFLKLVKRSVREVVPPAVHADEKPDFQDVAKLEVESQIFQSWQEAVETEVAVPICNLESLSSCPLEWPFTFPAKEESEPLCDAGGSVVGLVVRRQDAITGSVQIGAVRLADGLCKVQVRVENRTSLDNTGEIAVPDSHREQALMRSLVSAHTLLGVVDGEFISLLDPPEYFRKFVSNCRNIGTWPVLVGDEGQRDTMLSSPIILYDYPQIAPESPGDLFDGTEIDEILALRIMTMTDEEKREMRQSDDRARRILERTETMPMEQLMKLHGTLRELRSLKPEMS
jgi:hydrogenase maturation protease